DGRRLGPVLTDEDRLRSDAANVGRQLLQEFVGLRLVVLQLAGTVGEKMARSVQAEAVDSAVQPMRRDALHLLPHRRRGEIEVGHSAPENAIVVGPVLLVPGMVGTAPRLGPARIVGAPDVPVAVLRGRRRGRVEEPGVLGAGVIHHEIQDHLDAAPVRLGDQAVEIGPCAVVRIDRLVIGGVVAVVARRLEDRHEPEGVDAEVAQIIELRGQALEIADAVAVRVGEAAHENLVEDRAARPLVIPLRDACRLGRRCDDHGWRSRSWSGLGGLRGLDPRLAARARGEENCSQQRRRTAERHLDRFHERYSNGLSGRIFMRKASAAVFVALFLMLLPGSLHAAAPAVAFASRIDPIVSRPEFRHAFWGIAFLDLDTGETVYELNADKLFTPGSTTKLLTEGTALALLGPDYRFTTRIYRTGAIGTGGVLSGDLVLVASGDPNLSGRLRPDGTLAFENEDHSYGGDPSTRAVPGDPLLVIRRLAAQVADKGIRAVHGQVRVDVSLFPEGERELGTGTVISPVVVNDNVIDVTVGPGATPDAPAVVTTSPATSYVRFINQIKTGAAGSLPTLNDPADIANPDGTHTVTLSGAFPAGVAPILYSYPVPEPSRFAATVLREALAEKGVRVEPGAGGAAAVPLPARQVVAEHVSAPFREEVKVTLKVSQ